MQQTHKIFGSVQAWFNQTPKRGLVFGFTLIELVVGVAVMTILLAGVLGATSSIVRSAKVAREKTILNSLVSADLEIVRNLPYSQIGTVNGNPTGALADASNPKSITSEGRSYQIYYEVTYLDDPADGTVLSSPADTAPNDYKQVKMFVREVASGKVTSILTNFSPKGLEGLVNAGALVITVFDAAGQPVPNASVHIENLAINPDIVLDRTTDSSGRWIEVGLPVWVNGYHIVATKTGYSTDQTYPITAQNPNPIKPDSTIANGTVTQVSFAIDLLSNLTIKTVNQFCQSISGVGINVRGAKTIGTSPTVYKFDNNYTSSGGQVQLSNIEWDTYTPVLQAGEPYTIYGTSPAQQVTVLPNTTQTFTFVLGAATTNSLRVIVKDAATGAPIEGAAVHLQKGGSVPQDYYATTGGSVWSQADWSGGSGQTSWLPQPPNRVDKYASDDGNIDSNSAPTGMRLRKTSGKYALSGMAESSTFDTGTGASNFTTITWEPTSQNPATTLKFQIATSNDPAHTWVNADFKGPDGTSGSYYTVSGTTINSVHDNNQYMRYRVYESTTDDKKTPVLTSLLVNYVSGCFTPGQVEFPGLTSGNNYDMDISIVGYQTYTENNFQINGNIVKEILMSP